MDLQGLRAVSKARDLEEKRLTDKRRNALTLILRHLLDFGYVDSYERLSTECGVSLNKVDVADNIDLLRVIQEFEDGYELKFGRKPKLVRKIAPGEGPGGGHEAPKAQRVMSAGAGAAAPPAGVLSGTPSHLPPVGNKGSSLDGPPVSGAVAAAQRKQRAAAAEDARKVEALERRQRAMDSYKPPSEVGQQRVAGVAVGGGPVIAGMSREDVNAAQAASLGAMAVQGAAVTRQARGHAEGGGSDSEPEDFFERRLIKPLPASLQGDLRELGSAISRDIFTENPNVRWEDIAGLDTAKRLLKEAVVQPIRYPELFTGLLAPWKGVLLYGPPGTGKTMLAKAVATECRTTFFNVQASTIISKWRGDSEKLVRVLFELARHHAPSTIFMDEIDALMMARGAEGEHEASRRMKTELLIQMDGLAKTNSLVFVLCATNLPWELDMAMLRRLEKRILVPLPSLEARARMFESLLTGRCAPGVSWEHLAKTTEGYSGSDVMLVAKEAAMRPLRRLMAQLEAPTQPSGNQGSGTRISAKTELEPVQVEDVEAALAVTKPSARLQEAKYTQFSEEYGQSGT